MSPKTINIAVVPGDGIGPEITAQAVRVLNAVGEHCQLQFNYRYADAGGAAYDKQTATLSSQEKNKIDSWDDAAKQNLTLPQETIETMDWARDTKGAILFGSIGRTDLPKRTAELALLGMRKRYQVVNNRPFIIDPILAHNSILFRKPVQIQGTEIISPEESLFSGKSQTQADYSYTRKQLSLNKIEKTIQTAFEKAKSENKKILCASKYNVLVSEKLLSDTFEKYAHQYKGQVTLNEWSAEGQLIIDNAGMQLAANPERYANTIIIVDQMFGSFLQSILSVVSGACPVNESALALIKEKGIYRTFIRELCGGLYFGDRQTAPDYAFDTLHYTAQTISDLATVAHRVNTQLQLPSVDSLEIDGVQTFKFWADTLDQHSNQNHYSLRHMNIKKGVQTLLTDPATLGTVISSNMMGDIFTDLAAAVVGKSLGTMPSSAVNADGFGIYEQIAGSAPDIAGKGLANPIAEIRSAAMMLEDYHEEKAAQLINNAISAVLKIARTGDIWEPGFERVTTQQMGDLIIRNLNA